MYHNRDVVLFVISVASQGQDSRAQAILLNPFTAAAIPNWAERPCAAWALLRENTTISWCLPMVGSIEVTDDRTGDQIISQGNDENPEYFCRRVVQAAMNYFEIILDRPMPGNECPFFLVPGCDWEPMQVEAILQVRPADLSEYPDFQARLAWQREFDRGDPFLPQAIWDRRSFRFLQAARSYRIAVCRWIPFGIDSYSGNCGVIELLEEIGEQQFRVVIHVPNRFNVICAGTTLARVVTWMECGQPHRVEAEIADVIALL